ncbi:MAG TPA: bifunctional DNA-formamidopyrimidine glycosylase/DNA-(apurinic or apyrimidinic site) lyase [Candidatus Eisenbacteria bacterium]|nr:bifunctional DNA-formamidopyrimidine glycosylase/DNA-(apurinic or apyrimidinic site) lyase [Candidatus Eisenbacteria bacterium]
MPELPEVEAVAQALRPLVVRQRIRCVHVFHAIVCKPQSAPHVSRMVEGGRVEEVLRRGKYLFLRLDRGLVEMHFRFDGQLVWFPGAKDMLRRANEPDGVHVDLAFEFGKGALGFSDHRHFGRVHAWESEAECAPLQRLGVDAFDREFTAKWLHARASGSRRSLKEFLLDQTRVAGIGNIYSSEALWRARLDPWRSAGSLDGAESARLHKAIVRVLRRALECCQDPPPDFRDPNWWFQGLENILRAYQREGLPCRRCGRPIQRVEQGGRATYHCGHCQK